MSLDSHVDVLGEFVDACSEGAGVDCATIGMTLLYGASRAVSD